MLEFMTYKNTNLLKVQDFINSIVDKHTGWKRDGGIQVVVEMNDLTYYQIFVRSVNLDIKV